MASNLECKINNLLQERQNFLHQPVTQTLQGKRLTSKLHSNQVELSRKPKPHFLLSPASNWREIFKLMGRRLLNGPDSIVIQNDPSPFSAASNFRQLDHVFLQTQTRIWLGEVLKTRLDEDISITDILADGILLFEVSKVIWKMLLTKFMKLRSSMAYFSKSASGKSIGRYMPYSNVDSFLKICQIMGLTGIDLFSPSDVVEKRDIRGVCMCIRSLSKKAISKDLDIPDFDVVTYTVPMPTHMVKGIRKSLEQSHNRFSEDSAGCNTYFVSRSKHGQRNWSPAFAGQYDTYSEESDNTDSNYQVAGFSSPDYPASWSATSWGGVSLLNSDTENSPRGSSLDLENFHITQCILQTDEQAGEIDGSNNGSCSRSPEAEGSLDAYHLLNDIHRSTDTLPYSRTPPSRFDYSMEVNGGTSCGNKEAVRRSLNTPEAKKIRVWPVNFYPKSYESSVGHTMNNSKSERNVIGHSGTLNTNGYGTVSDESMFITREKDAVSNLQRDTDLHGSDSVNKISVYRGNKPFDGIEDGDVSSTAFSALSTADTSDNEDKLQGNDAIISPSVQLPQHQKWVKYPLLVDNSTPNIDKLHLEEVDSTKDLPTKESQLTISHEIKGPEASEFLTPHSVSASSFCQSPIGVSRDTTDLNYTYPVIDDMGVCGSNIKRPNEGTRKDLIGSPLLGDGLSTTIESRREALNGKDIALATKEQMCSGPDSYTLSMVDACDVTGHHIASVALDPCLKESENHPCKKPTSSESNDREAQTDQHFLDENELESAHQACKYHEAGAMEKEQITPEQEGSDVGASEHKLRRKRLLKSFAGGISVVGVLLLFFHIRRANSKEKINEPSVPAIQTSKLNNGENFQKNREQKGRADGVYPAENLKF